MDTFVSDVSNLRFPMDQMVSAKIVRHSIFNLILEEHPEFNPECVLSINELSYFRKKYVLSILTRELEELSDEDQLVLSSIASNTILTDKTEDEDDNVSNLSFGQRLADKIAKFGGSWIFIVSFGIYLFLWIFLNIMLVGLYGKDGAFDPYPFIFLNLILSCLAAIQAPLIMMSQNRQEEKDRFRARQDYMVNLKSELEIRILHEKLDHLIMDQIPEILKQIESNKLENS